MTAHAERVGVLAVLGLLMIAGWCAVALGVSAGSDVSGARTIGALVSKREGSTTIVIGGPFAAAAIVVSNDPAEPSARPVRAGEASDAVPDVAAASEVTAVSASVPVSEASVVLDASPVPDFAVLPALSVAAEADKILADSAALEQLWRLPAATADQRGPVAKQA